MKFWFWNKFPSKTKSKKIIKGKKKKKNYQYKKNKIKNLDSN